MSLIVSFPMLELLWRIPFLAASPIPPHVLLTWILFCCERLDLWTVHKARHLVRLPLLKTKTHALTRVVLVVCLICRILDLDEVRAYLLHGRVRAKRALIVTVICMSLNVHD